ncbi:MAG: NAD(P)H-dependent oxidoreductase [Pseudomonadota bacterium]
MTKHSDAPFHLAILGTSRSGGNTAQALFKLVEKQPVTCVDLNDLAIAPYHYEHAYAVEDDFHALAKRLASAETILLATPVYWYTMSAQMKVFFDRLSDLLTIRKPLGRALAGKRLSFLSVGTQAELPQGFADPFWQTCDYFDMVYHPGLYLQAEDVFEMTEGRKQIMMDFAIGFWGPQPTA